MTRQKVVAVSGVDDERSLVGMQTSFALYSASSRVIRLHRPLLEPLGLTYPQFLVMLALYEHSPRSVGDLGALLGMDNGTLTPLLKRLEAAELLTRTRDVSDERRVWIDLTAAGRALKKRVVSVPGQIDAACLASKDELAALRDTLNALAMPVRDEPGGIES